MSMLNDQVAQLEAAIAAQEGLRATVGDAIADACIAALRQQIVALRSQGNGVQLTGALEQQAAAGELETRALADLQGLLPAELAAKAQAAPRREGERRQVTLLFADLSGFTAVSETADPELIRAFQHDLFRELARIIYQYEGFVEKFVGDAVMAIFGAPVAHEDDPQRALRAALAIRERMSALNRVWSERLGAVLTLHAGVNTGEVVAGTIGGHPNDAGAAYAVTGDTVNTASRLQDAAKPGQILVSRTTYRLAQEAFSFVAHEPITVKNKREPLAVYELTRARSLPGKLRGIAGMAEVFVGRDADLKALASISDDLRGEDGKRGGRIVFISGEAGIGKSRLIAEWRKRTPGDARWLEGRCFAHTTSLPYGPMLDMIRRYAGIVDDDTERRARRRLDEAIDRLIPGNEDARAIFASLLAMRLSREETARLAKLEARELRDRIFSLVTELFTRLLQERTVILYLDDMHWADKSTVELAEHLFALVLSQPLIIVISTRPIEAPAMARLRDKLDSDEYRTHTLFISLVPLPESSSVELVRGLLGVQELPSSLGEIVSKAEGNPFFVEEMIRTLIERGALVREKDAWTTTAVLRRISDRIPDTLNGLIMERIDRLPDETKYVVQHAAVIGRTFLYRVLLEIAEHSPSLDADLSHLQRIALIRERTRDPEVEFTFQHALTQEMAYQTLLRTRARDLHRRVAEAMERIFAGRRGEYYPMLADQFRKGEVWDKAGEYFILAADHASRLFAVESHTLYREALRALKQVRPATPEVKRSQVDATVSLAREVFLGRGGEVTVPEVTELLHTAEDLALSLAQAKRAKDDDRERMARVQIWLGRAYGRQDLKKMVEYLDKAGASAVRDPELAAFAGYLRVNQGRFDEAEKLLTAAVGPLQSKQRWLEWANANGALAIAMAAQKRCGDALKRAEMGVDRSRNLQGQSQAPLVIAANMYLGLARYLCGDFDGALELSRTNRVEAASTRNALLEALAVSFAMHAAAHHPSSTAMHELKQIVEEHPAIQPHPVLKEWRDPLHARMKLVLDNDPVGAARMAEEAVNLGRERSNVFGEALAHRVWAQALHAQDSSHPDIDTHMRRSIDLFTNGRCYVEVERTRSHWDEMTNARH